MYIHWWNYEGNTTAGGVRTVTEIFVHVIAAAVHVRVRAGEKLLFSNQNLLAVIRLRVLDSVRNRQCTLQVIL